MSWQPPLDGSPDRLLFQVCVEDDHDFVRSQRVMRRPTSFGPHGQAAAGPVARRRNRRRGAGCSVVEPVEASRSPRYDLSASDATRGVRQCHWDRSTTATRSRARRRVPGRRARARGPFEGVAVPGLRRVLGARRVGACPGTASSRVVDRRAVARRRRSMSSGSGVSAIVKRRRVSPGMTNNIPAYGPRSSARRAGPARVPRPDRRHEHPQAARSPPRPATSENSANGATAGVARREAQSTGACSRPPRNPHDDHDHARERGRARRRPPPPSGRRGGTRVTARARARPRPP